MTEARWDRTFQTGIKATWYCYRAVFPHMKDRGGKIVNIGSAWGVNGAPGWSDYAGCKEAIRAFSRSAAREWGKHKIYVNTICPGLDNPNVQKFIREQMSNTSDQALTQDAVAAIAKSANTVGWWGDAELDDGPVAIFLYSSDSGYMTGQTFHVDGGGLITA